jgi:hypothetical protein
MTKTTKIPVRIMIIEHEEDILTLFKDYLSLKGHHVVSKYLSGPNAILLLNSIDFPLFL